MKTTDNRLAGDEARTRDVHLGKVDATRLNCNARRVTLPRRKRRVPSIAELVENAIMKMTKKPIIKADTEFQFDENLLRVGRVIPRCPYGKHGFEHMFYTRTFQGYAKKFIMHNI